MWFPTYLKILCAHWTFIRLAFLQPKPYHIMLIFCRKGGIFTSQWYQDLVFFSSDYEKACTQIHRERQRTLTTFISWASNYPSVIVRFNNSRCFLPKQTTEKSYIKHTSKQLYIGQHESTELIKRTHTNQYFHLQKGRRKKGKKKWLGHQIPWYEIMKRISSVQIQVA